jgi:translation elongation factor EF-G
VEAYVPLAELLGYASALRRLASGRASFTMSLLRYDVMSDQRQRLAVSRNHGVS